MSTRPPLVSFHPRFQLALSPAHRLPDFAASDIDQILAARSARGDDEAFRRLVLRHHEQLYRWALALTGDPDDADDVEQAALLRVHRGLPRYRPQGKFSTWLYSVVRSAAADLRRVRRRREVLLAEMAGEASESSSPDPASEMDRERLTALVLGCYQDLPARQREVFSLADLQGYSSVEIAALTGLEPVTIRTHLLRARRAIRQRILAGHPALSKEFNR